MLGEIAKLDALRQTDVAAKRRQFTGQQFNQRRFTRTVAAQQPDTRPWHQVELNRVEDDSVAIAGADFFHFQQRIGQAFWRTEAKVERVIHVGRGDKLHTLKHFDAALRLLRFAGFGLEAIDETLQMRHALLLAFVHCLLLRQTGCALTLEGAVVSGVFEHGLLFDMNNFIDHRIEKVTIVGDKNQSALIAL